MEPRKKSKVSHWRAALVIGGLFVLGVSNVPASRLGSLRGIAPAGIAGAYIGVLLVLRGSQLSAKRRRIVGAVVGGICGACGTVMMGKSAEIIILSGLIIAGIGYLADLWLPHTTWP